MSKQTSGSFSSPRESSTDGIALMKGLFRQRRWTPLRKDYMRNVKRRLISLRQARSVRGARQAFCLAPLLFVSAGFRPRLAPPWIGRAPAAKLSRYGAALRVIDPHDPMAANTHMRGGQTRYKQSLAMEEV